MDFGSPSLNQGSEVAAVHFSVSVTYYIAFRNPKYGGSASSKDLPSKSVTFADNDDDLPPVDPNDYDDDMDDVPAAAAAAAPAAAVRPRDDNFDRGVQRKRVRKNV